MAEKFVPYHQELVRLLIEDLMTLSSMLSRMTRRIDDYKTMEKITIYGETTHECATRVRFSKELLVTCTPSGKLDEVINQLSGIKTCEDVVELLKERRSAESQPEPKKDKPKERPKKFKEGNATSLPEKF